MSDSYEYFTIADYAFDEFDRRFGQSAVEQLFQEIDTTDVASNTVEFPVLESGDFDSSVTAEGEAIDRVELDHNNVRAEYAKYAFEVTPELVEDDVDDALDQIFATMAYEASKELYDNFTSTTIAPPKSVDSMLGAHIVSEMLFELVGEYHDLDTADTIVVPEVLIRSIVTDDDDDVVDDFVTAVERQTGMEVLVDTYGVLRGGDVLLADTTRLGFRPVRTYPNRNYYYDYHVETDVTQVYCRMTHVVLDETAGRFGRLTRIP
jgi:hypothetical protein